MAKGRPPSGKPLQRERAQRAKDASYQVLADTGDTYGEPLPQVEGVTWHNQTVQWWESWRRNPLAQTFTPVEWSYLEDTAYLHTAMWSGDYRLAGEIRLRVGQFGATTADRERLRLRVEIPTQGQPEVHMDKQRRDRLKLLVERD